VPALQPRTWRSAARALPALAAAVLLAACSSPAGALDPDPTAGSARGTAQGPVPATASWTGYHADQARTGAVPGSPGTVQRAWRARLGGAVRGQPLVSGGRVLAATETNRVVALDPRTGAVQWSTSLGRPLTDVRDVVGCGNIDPLGVTSTGVVDEATGTLWVVAEVDDGGGKVHHRLAGLDVATGRITASAPVDPPFPAGQSPVHLLQRASLALANGRVYVPYGGHIGDCGEYHGWVVGADEADPTNQVSFQVAADGLGGAIWQSGGAPAIDAAGDVYVSTGNADPFPPEGGPDPKQYTESVVKLSPDLAPLAAYKDTVAGGDEDLSTGNPVLLPDGTVFSVGKTDIAFFLRQADLRQVAAVPGVCGSDPDGGPAYDAASGRVFVPCRRGGLQVVDVRAHRLGPRLDGADSAPVVVGGTVWAVDTGSARLTAFDAATGRLLQQVDVGADVPVFTSPSAGAGVLLVATTDGVVAFR
jgi:polyvinyl alcohol dehydrogenase (cytochrome)